MSVEALVGSIAGELVLETLRRQESGEPLVMLTGFNPTEVLHALALLDGKALPAQSEPVHVVVAAHHESAEFMTGSSPNQVRLGSDQTLTQFRNRLRPSGLVMIAIGDQSDAEGLKEIYRIGDESVLDNEGVVAFEERFAHDHRSSMGKRSAGSRHARDAS